MICRCTRLLVLLMLGAIPVLAQHNISPRPHYQLLWRISGPQLPASSYLFGTMHVQDERAFDFSDSVLLKITECQAFAMEVHPDSLLANMFAGLMDLSGSTRQNDQYFKKLLGERDYHILDSIMKRRTGYALSRFQSPAMVRMFLEKKNLKKDKSTFLDAYLYDLARRQGKTVIGLEDPTQVLQLLDSADKRNIRRELIQTLHEPEAQHNGEAVDNLVNIYYEGDLDAIDRYLHLHAAMSPTYYDLMITQRNHAMVPNIMNAIRRQSTFIAVGAGHLPGTQGLIALLRKKGYRVAPVIAPFTGLARQYTFQETAEPWYTYTSEKGGYRLEIPQRPFPIRTQEQGPTLMTYFDIGKPMLYQTSFFPVSTEWSSLAPTAVLSRIEQSMGERPNTKILSSQAITWQGLPGREVFFQTGDHQYRVQCLLRDHILYMNLVGADAAVLQTPEANHFLTSFQPTPLLDETWQEQTDDEGAYRVRMAGDVAQKSLEVPSDQGTYHIHLRYADNLRKHESYLVRYNDFPEGYVISNDSTYYDAMVDEIYTDMAGSNLTQMPDVVQGFPGRSFRFSKGAHGEVKGRAVLRGTRTYLMLATVPKNKPGSADAFLTSLQLLPYQSTAKKLHHFEADEFSLLLPASFQAKISSDSSLMADNIKTYYCRDANSGILYMIQVESLSPYLQYESEENIWDIQRLHIQEEEDSIYYDKHDYQRLKYWHELQYANPHTNTITTIKYIQQGLRRYRLTSFAPVDYALSDMHTAFFNSFQYTGHDTLDVLSDKTALILADAASMDSTKSAEALESLEPSNFSARNLPQLYKGFKQYKHVAIRKGILDILEKYRDVRTVDFIQEVYPALLDDQDLAWQALWTLASTHQQQAVDLMRTLLTTHSLPDDGSLSTVFTPLADSLELYRSLIPRLEELLPAFRYPANLFSLTEACIEAGMLSPDEVTTARHTLLTWALRYINQLPAQQPADNQEESTSLLLTIYDILDKLPDDVIRITNQRLLAYATDHRLLYAGVALAFKQHTTPPASVIDTLAADPYYRASLFKVMMQHGVVSRFPKSYGHSQQLAESQLWRYIVDVESTEPDALTLLSKQAVMYQGKKQQVYIYQYRYTDNAWYLAVSGPFPRKGKITTFNEDLTFTAAEKYDPAIPLTEALQNMLDAYELDAQVIKK